MKYLFTILLLTFCRPSFSQKLVYDIFLFGNKIGQSVIEKTIRNDSITRYTLNSASEATVFFTTRKVSLIYDILYKNDQLFSSYSKNTRNDEVHITTIKWENNTYIMKREDGSFCIKPLVDCSTVKLFFHEPCDNQKIFSERLGEYRVIKKTGEALYQAEMKEGITYYYHYKNDKLVELEMRKGLLGSIYLRPHTL